MDSNSGDMNPGERPIVDIVSSKGPGSQIDANADLKHLDRESSKGPHSRISGEIGQHLSSQMSAKQNNRPSTSNLPQAIQQQQTSGSKGRRVGSALPMTRKVDPTVYTELRNQFQAALAKITQNPTKQMGIEQCHKLIAQYKGDQLALRVFIGVLTDNKTLGINASKSGNRECHVLIFGFLAKTFGLDLKDPKDKPPSLVKTVKRILSSIDDFFKDDNKIVNKAVGMSMQSILENCFPDEPYSEDTITLFFGHLNDLLQKGTDRISEKGAAQCLLALCQTQQQQGNIYVLIKVWKLVVDSYIKNKLDHDDLIYLIQLFVQKLQTELPSSLSLANYLESLITWTLKVAANSKINTSRIAACSLLGTLAQVFNGKYAHYLVPFFANDIFLVLDELSKSKLTKLQQASNEAKKAWKDLETETKSSEPDPQFIENLARRQVKFFASSVSKSPNKDQIHSKLDNARNLQKQQKEVQKRWKSGQERVVDPYDSSDKDMANKLKAGSFLRKGQGQGGGVREGFSPSQSHEKMLQELNKIKYQNKSGSKSRGVGDLFNSEIKGMFSKGPQVTNMAAFKSTSQNAPQANYRKMTDQQKQAFKKMSAQERVIFLAQNPELKVPVIDLAKVPAFLRDAFKGKTAQELCELLEENPEMVLPYLKQEEDSDQLLKPNFGMMGAQQKEFYDSLSKADQLNFLAEHPELSQDPAKKVWFQAQGRWPEPNFQLMNEEQKKKFNNMSHERQQDFLAKNPHLCMRQDSENSRVLKPDLGKMTQKQREQFSRMNTKEKQEFLRKNKGFQSQESMRSQISQMKKANLVPDFSKMTQREVQEFNSLSEAEKQDYLKKNKSKAKKLDPFSDMIHSISVFKPNLSQFSPAQKAKFKSLSSSERQKFLREHPELMTQESRKIHEELQKCNLEPDLTKFQARDLERFKSWEPWRQQEYLKNNLHLAVEQSLPKRVSSSLSVKSVANLSKMDSEERARFSKMSKKEQEEYLEQNPHLAMNQLVSESQAEKNRQSLNEVEQQDLDTLPEEQRAKYIQFLNSLSPKDRAKYKTLYPSKRMQMMEQYGLQPIEFSQEEQDMLEEIDSENRGKYVSMLQNMTPKERENFSNITKEQKLQFLTAKGIQDEEDDLFVEDKQGGDQMMTEENEVINPTGRGVMRPNSAYGKQQTGNSHTSEFMRDNSPLNPQKSQASSGFNQGYGQNQNFNQQLSSQLSQQEPLQLTEEETEAISALTKQEKKQLEGMSQQEKKQYLQRKAKQIEQEALDDLNQSQINIIQEERDPVKKKELQEQFVADNKWLQQVKANLTEKDQQFLAGKDKQEAKLYLKRYEMEARRKAENLLTEPQKEAFERMNEQEKKLFLREVYKTHSRAKELASNLLTPQEQQMLKNMNLEEQKQFLEQKAQQFEKQAFKDLTPDEKRQFELADGVEKQKILLRALERKGIAAPSTNLTNQVSGNQRGSITSGEQTMSRGGQKQGGMNMSISDQLLQSYTPQQRANLLEQEKKKREEEEAFQNMSRGEREAFEMANDSEKKLILEQKKEQIETQNLIQELSPEDQEIFYNLPDEESKQQFIANKKQEKAKGELIQSLSKEEKKLYFSLSKEQQDKFLEKKQQGKDKARILATLSPVEKAQMERMTEQEKEQFIQAKYEQEKLVKDAIELLSPQEQEQFKTLTSQQKKQWLQTKKLEKKAKDSMTLEEKQSFAMMTPQQQKQFLAAKVQEVKNFASVQGSRNNSFINDSQTQTDSNYPGSITTNQVSNQEVIASLNSQEQAQLQLMTPQQQAQFLETKKQQLVNQDIVNNLSPQEAARFKQMTPQQQSAFLEQKKEQKEKLDIVNNLSPQEAREYQSMSTEQKAQLIEKKREIKAKQEIANNLSPQEAAQFAQMNAEQKNAFLEKKKDEKDKQDIIAKLSPDENIRYQAMTPQQKELFIEQKKQVQDKQKIIASLNPQEKAKFNSMTPNEQKTFLEIKLEEKKNNAIIAELSKEEMQNFSRLSPEEKKAYIEQKKEQKLYEKVFSSLTPQEKQAINLMSNQEKQIFLEQKKAQKESIDIVAQLNPQEKAHFNSLKTLQEKEAFIAAKKNEKEKQKILNSLNINEAQRFAQMTPEQQNAFIEKKKEELKDQKVLIYMTPEERENFERLTPAQKQSVITQKRKELEKKEVLAQMNPQELEQFKRLPKEKQEQILAQKVNQKKIKDQIQNLSPQEKVHFQKLDEAGKLTFLAQKEIKKENQKILDSLSLPEKQAYANMTQEQKLQFLAKKRDEEKTQEIISSLSPKEKKMFHSLSPQDKQKFIQKKKETEENQKAYNSLTQQEKQAYAKMSPQQKQQLLNKKKQQLGLKPVLIPQAQAERQRKQQILKKLSPMQREALKKMPPQQRKTALAKMFNQNASQRAQSARVQNPLDKSLSKLTPQQRQALEKLPPHQKKAAMIKILAKEMEEEAGLDLSTKSLKSKLPLQQQQVFNSLPPQQQQMLLEAQKQKEIDKEALKKLPPQKRAQFMKMSAEQKKAFIQKNPKILQPKKPMPDVNWHLMTPDERQKFSMMTQAEKRAYLYMNPHLIKKKQDPSVAAKKGTVPDPSKMSKEMQAKYWAMNPEKKQEFRMKNPQLFLGSEESKHYRVKTNLDLSSLTPQEKQYFKSLPKEEQQKFVKERPHLVVNKETVNQNYSSKSSGRQPGQLGLSRSETGKRRNISYYPENQVSFDQGQEELKFQGMGSNEFDTLPVAEVGGDLFQQEEMQATNLLPQEDLVDMCQPNAQLGGSLGVIPEENTQLDVTGDPMLNDPYNPQVNNLMNEPEFSNASPKKQLYNLEEVNEAVQKGLIPPEKSLKAAKLVKSGLPYEVEDREGLLTGESDPFHFRNYAEIDQAVEEGAITLQEAQEYKLKLDHRREPDDIDADVGDQNILKLLTEEQIQDALVEGLIDEQQADQALEALSLGQPLGISQETGTLTPLKQSKMQSRMASPHSFQPQFRRPDSPSSGMLGMVVRDQRLADTEEREFGNDLDSQGLNERETGFNVQNPWEQDYGLNDKQEVLGLGSGDYFGQEGVQGESEYLGESLLDDALGEDQQDLGFEDYQVEESDNGYVLEEEANEYEMNSEQIRALEEKGFNPEQIEEIKEQMQQGFKGLTDKIEKMSKEIASTKQVQMEIEKKQLEEELQNQKRENAQLTQFGQLQEVLHGYQQQLTELKMKENKGNSFLGAEEGLPGEENLGLEDDYGLGSNEDLFQEAAGLELDLPLEQESTVGHRMSGQPLQSSGAFSQNPVLSPSQSRQSLFWANAWQLANEGEFEQAYKIVLKECDDIQLLKLVSKTGSVVRHLTEKTSRRVLNRMNRIMRSGSIQTMAISWFSEANTVGLMSRLDRKDKNEYLDSLYTCFQKAENDQLKQQAKRIYKEIRETQAKQA